MNNNDKIAKVLKDNGVAPDTPMGRMMAGVITSMAEFEERTIAARAEAIRAMGDKIPHEAAKRVLRETVETLAREGIDSFSVAYDSVFDDGKKVTFFAYDNETGERVMVVITARAAPMSEEEV